MHSTTLTSKPPCIFTVDVEDWFHILDVRSSPPISQWDELPSRVERNFLRMLDILEEHGVRATCFILGWIARKHPNLVREAVRRGHEPASHGYAHRLAYRMTEQEFYTDVAESRRMLEQVAGRSVVGYRCPGFSVTETLPWFFESLVRAGYKYDSSVFPGRRSHGGMRNGLMAPHVIHSHSGELIEFPMTLSSILGVRVCLYGGGYLRLFPISLTRSLAHRVLGEGRPVIFYVHPRDIDPHQPRLSMGLTRRFRSYVNLASTEGKLRILLKTFQFKRFEDLLTDYSPTLRTDSDKAVRQNCEEVTI